MATQGVFPLGDVVFFSNFDSGNLIAVERKPNNWVGATQFELWIGADAKQLGHTAYRVWFYFGIRGLTKGSPIRMSIMNFAGQRSLFSNRYKIVWSTSPARDLWTKLSAEIGFEALAPNSAKISWDFEPVGEGLTHYFAFAYPYSLEKLERTLSQLQGSLPPHTYFHREVLTYSLQSRPVEVLTITSRASLESGDEERLSGLFPTSTPRAQRYELLRSWKPVIFITARVHPGETVASFMLDGLLKALLHPFDKRSAALRSNFQFKIIPVLNPDGVYNGHFRLDVSGVNLNRCYIAPDREKFPAVYAVKSYFEYLNKVAPLCAYFDLHGHSSKRGCFLFGNALQGEELIESRLFARLVHLNSSFFEYSECDFSERSMFVKDPKDEHSKEGSSRVSLHRMTGLLHSYTIECNANIGRLVHGLSPLVNTATGKRYVEVTNKGKVISTNARERGVLAFEEVGAGLLWAVLDLKEKNPLSRVPSSEHMTVEGVREWVRTVSISELRPRPSPLAKRPKESTPETPEERPARRTLPVKAVAPSLNIPSRFPSLLQAGRSFLNAPTIPKFRTLAGRI